MTISRRPYGRRLAGLAACLALALASAGATGLAAASASSSAAAPARDYGPSTPAVSRSAPGGGVVARAHAQHLDEAPDASRTGALPQHVARAARSTEQGEAGKVRADQGQATPSTKASTNVPASVPVRSTFPGTGQGGSGFFPPDVSLAAGPYQVLEIVNGRFTVYDKNGTQASTTSDGAFFAPVTSDGVFDPHVVYDEYIGRFVILETSQSDSPARSHLLLAVSATSDATQGWNKYSFDATVDGGGATNNWCDYPHLGYSRDAFFFTCNQFSFPSSSGSFQYSKIRIMSTPQFLGGSCCFWWDKWDLREGTFNTSHVFTIQPATMHNAISSDGGFLVAAEGGGGGGDNLHVYRVPNPLNCCSPGNQTDPGLDVVERGVGSYDTPPSALQPSGAAAIDTGDTRLLYAVFDWPTLFTGQDLASGGHATVSFTEMTISSYPTVPTPLNDWVFPAGSDDVYYPAVDSNLSHDKSMSYTRSSTGLFAGSYSVDIPRASSCTSCLSGQTTLHAGASTYVQKDSSGRNRWGDYLGAARDPNGTGIWLGGEYVSGTDTWGTELALARQVNDTTAPFTSSSLSPPLNSAGWVNSSTTAFLSATDPGIAGVRWISYSAFGSNPVGSTVVPGSSASVGIIADGVTTLLYQARDNWGNVEPLRGLTIRKDSAAPTVTGPAPGLATGGTVTANGVPVTLTWTGSDALSGVARYDLARKTDNGAFTPIGSTSSPTTTVTLAPGHKYQFQATSVDNAGNRSTTVNGRAFTVRLFQETAPTIAYAGTWGTQAITGSSGGSVRFANTNGPTATFTGTGFAFAWVSTLASNRGSATVRLDGGTAATVDTNGFPQKSARLVYARAVPAGTHTIAVRDLGTSGHPRIDVDAFVVLS